MLRGSLDRCVWTGLLRSLGAFRVRIAPNLKGVRRRNCCRRPAGRLRHCMSVFPTVKSAGHVLMLDERRYDPSGIVWRLSNTSMPCLPHTGRPRSCSKLSAVLRAEAFGSAGRCRGRSAQQIRACLGLSVPRLLRERPQLVAAKAEFAWVAASVRRAGAPSGSLERRASLLLCLTVDHCRCSLSFRRRCRTCGASRAI